MLKKSLLLLCLFVVSISAAAQSESVISGRIISKENKEIIGFATVYLKNTNYGTSADERGIYRLKVPAGDYTLVVSAIGYSTVERAIKLYCCPLKHNNPSPTS